MNVTESSKKKKKSREYYAPLRWHVYSSCSDIVVAVILSLETAHKEHKKQKCGLFTSNASSTREQLYSLRHFDRNVFTDSDSHIAMWWWSRMSNIQNMWTRGEEVSNNANLAVNTMQVDTHMSGTISAQSCTEDRIKSSNCNEIQTHMVEGEQCYLVSDANHRNEKKRCPGSEGVQVTFGTTYIIHENRENDFNGLFDTSFSFQTRHTHCKPKQDQERSQKIRKRKLYSQCKREGTLH